MTNKPIMEAHKVLKELQDQHLSDKAKEGLAKVLKRGVAEQVAKMGLKEKYRKAAERLNRNRRKYTPRATKVRNPLVANQMNLMAECWRQRHGQHIDSKTWEV